jgi:hypothetical protein
MLRKIGCSRATLNCEEQCDCACNPSTKIVLMRKSKRINVNKIQSTKTQ